MTTLAVEDGSAALIARIKNHQLPPISNAVYQLQRYLRVRRVIDYRLGLNIDQSNDKNREIIRAINELRAMEKS